MKTFGENLKNERENNNMTQGEFADLMQTTQQRVSEWECNKVEPTLSNILKILKVLNISFEDLTYEIEK